MQQGDNIPDGGRLSRGRFIYHRTQRRQFKVAVFLRKKGGKGISKCKVDISLLLICSFKQFVPVSLSPFYLLM